MLLTPFLSSCDVILDSDDTNQTEPFCIIFNYDEFLKLVIQTPDTGLSLTLLRITVIGIFMIYFSVSRGLYKPEANK